MANNCNLQLDFFSQFINHISYVQMRESKMRVWDRVGTFELPSSLTKTLNNFITVQTNDRQTQQPFLINLGTI